MDAYIIYRWGGVVDDGKQQPVREHVVISVVVVKQPSGSLTEHIESSKSSAGWKGWMGVQGVAM